MKYAIVKRILDFVFALLLGVFLLPFLLLISVVIKLSSPGPVLFKQGRVGKDKKIFDIYKFRTMRIDTPKLPPNKFHDVEKYITPIGAFLRKSSLDELPQLLNILKGEMSFVGPRPGAAKNEESLIKCRDKYNVFSVLPGITGWAQVNGRDELAHDEMAKARADGEYVKKISFKMDVACVLKTFHVVSLQDGYQEGAKCDNENTPSKGVSND